MCSNNIENAALLDLLICVCQKFNQVLISCQNIHTSETSSSNFEKYCFVIRFAQMVIYV